MNPRANVLVYDHAIGAADLSFLADYAAKAKQVDSLVSNFEDDAPDDTVEWVVNKRIRHTQDVHLIDEVRAKLNSILANNIRDAVNPFYDIEVRDWEPAQILHYGAGGHYIPHVDSETLYTDDRNRKFWEKTLDRDLSIVYFLNEDFNGGELVFPEFDFIVQPKAGTLVCFPSDHHYVHGVQPVTVGHRYTFVTWARVKGMPTPEEINQANMDEFHRRWPEEVEQPSRIVKASGRK